MITPRSAGHDRTGEVIPNQVLLLRAQLHGARRDSRKEHGVVIRYQTQVFRRFPLPVFRPQNDCPAVVVGYEGYLVLVHGWELDLVPRAPLRVWEAWDLDRNAMGLGQIEAVDVAVAYELGFGHAFVVDDDHGVPVERDGAGIPPHCGIGCLRRVPDRDFPLGGDLEHALGVGPDDV